MVALIILRNKCTIDDSTVSRCTGVGTMQSKSSFTLVSIILIIHNVINNKVFFYIQLLIKPLT